MPRAFPPALVALLVLAPALAACGGGGGDGGTNPPAVPGMYLHDMAGVDCG